MTVDETTEPVVRVGRSADDDDLGHIFCDCDENRALCGADVTDCPVVEDRDDSLLCVVCADLEDVPCERCGS